MTARTIRTRASSHTVQSFLVMLPRLYSDCGGQLGQANTDTLNTAGTCLFGLGRHTSRQHEITVRSLNFGPRASSKDKGQGLL